MHHQALTAEIIYAVLWLAEVRDDSTVVPAGSGVVVHHRGHEYLATAYHVAKVCDFDPLIRRMNEWQRSRWDLIVADEQRDLAVLRTTAPLAPLTPTYGDANTRYGSLGRAMGFPAFDNRSLENLNTFADIDGHPLPVTAVVSATVASNEGEFQYAGGYVNSGFSGGAIVFPTEDSGWTIVGVITERGAVLKEIGLDEQGHAKYIIEPTGIVKFVRMETVLQLIDSRSAARTAEAQTT